MAECTSHCSSSGSAGSSGHHFVSAVRCPASHARLWFFTIVGLAADLWSKHWAFTNVDPDRGIVIVENLARFQRSLNTGALFGLGKGWTPVFVAASILALAFVMYLFVQSGRERWSLHIALGLVLAGALGNLHDRIFVIVDVIQYADRQGRERLLEPGLINEEKSNEKSLVLDNYPERSRRVFINRDQIVGTWKQGVVRDFVKMEPRIPLGGGRWKEIWPWVYNIADVLLVAGVAILMLNFWRERREMRSARAKQEAAGSAGKSGS
ncbi:MAG: signal peptidase II [Sedimentisphaerales bacterium]|nr:signal peptidase II [Sedimentisphaerales bacterium]